MSRKPRRAIGRELSTDELGAVAGAYWAYIGGGRYIWVASTSTAAAPVSTPVVRG
jgi:hypothetical protein